MRCSNANFYWRILAWIMFILCTLATMLTMVGASISVKEPIGWEFNSASISIAYWYCERRIYLLPACLALGFASFAFFRKSVGLTLGISFMLYLGFALLAGLSSTLCAAILSHQGLIHVAEFKWTQSGDGEWAYFLVFTGLLLVPGLVSMYLQRMGIGCKRDVQEVRKGN